ncbi:MAG: Uma2 family endonuclease [Bryobacteraceae bacterium]
MATLTGVPVEEYLATSFEDGDREYVDGTLVERNVGEKPHSKTQKRLILFFGPLERTARIFAFPEQRVQVSPTRFRIPDVCVYIDEEPADDVFRTPPFLAIEILSRDDKASGMQEKIDDYLNFGVPFVWVIDPRTRRGYVHTRDGSREARDGVLRTANPTIEVPLEKLFE